MGVSMCSGDYGSDPKSVEVTGSFWIRPPSVQKLQASTALIEMTRTDRAVELDS